LDKLKILAATDTGVMPVKGFKIISKLKIMFVVKECAAAL
jgi:hypothetical protein